jgi:MFS family permease
MCRDNRAMQRSSHGIDSVTGIASAGLVALAVAMGIGRFAFTPILPMMEADAGLTLKAAGWLAAANYLGYLLGASCAARLPRAGAIRGSLSLIAVVTFAMGMTHAFALQLFLRLLAGVASAWVRACCAWR